MSQLRFRKDVQILRGVSVLFVVLYHLDFAAFKAGFLGVDVFFVISGYLMAKLYRPGQALQFVRKRVTRLVPAYFATLLCTVLACIILTTPNEFRMVVPQALFGLGFVSNIGYWFQNSYFSKAAFNPLLHLWSLGLEVQFYVLVPPLAALFRKFRGSLAYLTFFSLLACLLMVTVSPKTAFFWLPFRAWEFLFGYWIASRFDHSGTIKASPLLGGLGFAGVVIAPLISTTVSGVSTSIWNGHPALHAVAVVLATSLLLAHGLPRWAETNLLSKALVTLGKYSYSIYLVHFPVIVLVLYKPFSGTLLHPDTGVQMSLILLSISIVSLAMYHLIETPLRADTRCRRFVMMAVPAVLLSLPLGVWYQRATHTPEELAICQAGADRSPYRCGKLNRLLDPRAASFELGTPVPPRKRTLLMVGDSHADAIKSTFIEVASANGVGIRFLVGNDALMGGLDPDRIIEEAVSNGCDGLIVHYSYGAVPFKTLEEAILKATAVGLDVTYLMPVPVWPVHIPRALWAKEHGVGTTPSQTLANYNSANGDLRSGLKQLEPSGLKVYEVASFFLGPDGLFFLTDKSSRPLYFDDDHLTLTGSRVLKPLFETVISDLLKKSPRTPSATL